MITPRSTDGKSQEREREKTVVSYGKTEAGRFFPSKNERRKRDMKDNSQFLGRDMTGKENEGDPPVSFSRISPSSHSLS